MRFIHTADLHLFASLKSSALDPATHEKRVYELRDAFFRLLNYVTENDVEHLFVVGDLFDHSFINIEQARAIFARLSQLDCAVYLLIGNHDNFLLTSAYQSLLNAENIHIFTKDNPTIKTRGLTVHGLNTSAFTETRLRELNGSLDRDATNVLLLHGDVQNKHDDHYLTDVNTLKDTDFDYIALGHIHKHTVFTDRIAYSGNLEPLDFSETDEKGFIEGTIKDNHLTTTFVPFAKRRYRQSELTIKADWDSDALIENVKTVFDDSIRRTDFIRLTLKGQRKPSLTIDTDHIARLLSDDFFHLELHDQTRSTLDLNRLKKDYKDTLIDTMITDFEANGKQEDEAALLLALETLLTTSGVLE